MEIVDERLAGDGDRCPVEQVNHLSEHGSKAARPVEVVHEVGAGRLEVDEQRHASADLVEVVEGEINAETSGNREQMNDRVRRTSDRGERHDRVLKGSLCHDGARAPIGLDELDRKSPGGVGTFEQPAVGGWGAGEAGHHRAEGLGEQTHRRCSAHRVAVTATADHRRLRAIEIILRELAAANLLAEPPHVGATAERHAAKSAGEHRTTGHDDCGQVHRGRGHEERGDRLVATAKEHDGIDRVGAQHLLGRHGGHVSPEHGGRSDLSFTERHHRQVEWNASRLEDAVAHGCGHLIQMRVARSEIRRGVRDRDMGPARERIGGQAAPHPGAVNVGIAIIAPVQLGTAQILRHRVPFP